MLVCFDENFKKSDFGQKSISSYQDGVFLDADFEYQTQKIVRCVSRELWLFF